MSTNSQTLNTGQQATTNYDLSKIFILNNRYESDNYVNNSSYDPITLLAGTLMGRVGSTDVLVPFTSTANDGSQNPLGVLAHDITLAEGATAKATICVSGDINSSKVIFVKPGDGLDIVISNRRVKDIIGASTVGIKLVSSTEMTDYDNQ